MSLIGVQPLKKIIKLTLQTGWIKKEPGFDYPVNLLIIAKPESGKTQAVTYKIPGTYTTTNITQAVMVSKIFPMIENNGLKYMIIPDILNAIEKDRTTAKGFINMTKSLIEEGISNLDTFNLRTTRTYDPPIKCGMITATTTESYNGYYNPLTQRTEGGLKHQWKRIGLLSRFVPFSYSYGIEKIKEIFLHIEKQEPIKSVDDSPPIKRTKKAIYGDSVLFSQLEIISMKTGDSIGCYGVRLQRSLQDLVRANAMINGRDTLTQEDINEIIHLSNWINYDFNPM
jgi:hypothetical protein